ncbi:MAG: hypothetical protein AB1779_02720 [Candidatus Thermoplasmatota archaeon]
MTKLQLPHRKVYHSPGSQYVAEIYPGSCEPKGDKAICYFYKTDQPEPTWKRGAQLIWKAELVNRCMPATAVISVDGDLVTLNDYYRYGNNAVVIYDRNGKLVRSYNIGELVPKEEMDSISMLEIVGMGWFWNAEAEYYFLTDPARFCILLKWIFLKPHKKITKEGYILSFEKLPIERVMEFHLTDGKFRYGVPSDFPELHRVIGNPNGARNMRVGRESL